MTSRIAWAALALCLAGPAASPALAGTYADVVLADKPVAWWRLNEIEGPRVVNQAPSSAAGGYAPALDGFLEGAVTLGQPGPRPPLLPEFDGQNTAAGFNGAGSFIRVKIPGGNAQLTFEQGDSLTLEAWVLPRQVRDGQQVYIVGKGRTKNSGVAANNQNYALRLRGEAGSARVSFVFRDVRNAPNDDPKTDDHWHRWTSDAGFAEGSGWHHVAVTYTFGRGESLRGYLDGAPVEGRWDKGGKSDLAPVTDHDEVWIGSSVGGASENTFNGLIDEVAIYRRALPPDELRRHCQFGAVEIAAADLPKDAVRVDILESVPDQTSWNFALPEPGETYQEAAFGFASLPTRYVRSGIKADRSAPFLFRASGVVTLPPGEHRLLLRARTGSRLKLDGKVIATTKFPNLNADGHEEVPEAPVAVAPNIRSLQPGHFETLATIKSDGQARVFTLEAIIGSKGRRPELGELSASVALEGEDEFHLLSPGRRIVPLTEEGWTAYATEQRETHRAGDAQRRRLASAEEEKYWSMRHERARQLLAAERERAPKPPTVSAAMPVQNGIDRFLGARIEAAGARPAPLLDDWAFLRRATLDVIGTIPSRDQIEAFQRDASPHRRARAIDRLLAHPGWADHWVSYWQDVLAENPGILKPMLNNTGPFRWWLHDAFTDNKPIDRLATELILMEGSLYYGGPAGFGLATENDVPMGQKAQIVAQAFLGMQLQCARCHDAPYHDFKQQDLFSLAAMLRREPQPVPASSSIPTNANIVLGRVVNVTLKPGSKVEPAWPFATVMPDDLPDGTLRRANDSRERLAALVTDPRNTRFARVIANRLWKRYLGWGLIEPVDDWETARPSHPELLDWLALELMTHDYDLKHLARLILNSHAYQRAVTPEGSREAKPEERLFVSPARRRLTAEQVVDALFTAVGKPFEAEEMNLDVDGRRPVKDFNNLGTPHHAWEFTSLSNERDRPALAMPKAQAVVDALGTFGWRESRQSPLTVRDHSPNVLQPAALANGALGHARITRLSDDHAITALALEERPLREFIRGVFLQVLSRPPGETELQTFTEHLGPGYEQRRTEPSAANRFPSKPARRPVSWSNHLSPEATKIKQELEREARAGDPPTDRLRMDWRERAEDLLWVLINSPEFVFAP